MPHALSLASGLIAAVITLAAATAPGHAAQPSPAETLAPQSAARAGLFHSPVRIETRVSISRQTMEVFHEGRKLFEWPVSTARQGKVTPVGTWNGAQWLSRHHRSSLYNNAPMPFAIFYNGNYAIHGTDQISRLGRPASAGCVRLHPDHARILFDMVRAEGKDAIRVTVVR